MEKIILVDGYEVIHNFGPNFSDEISALITAAMLVEYSLEAWSDEDTPNASNKWISLMFSNKGIKICNIIFNLDVNRELESIDLYEHAINKGYTREKVLECCRKLLFK